MPVIDIVIGQIHGRFEPRIGPLSVAQGYHGVMLLVVLATLVGRLRTFPSEYQFVPFSCLCFGGGITLSYVSCLFEDKSAFEDAVASGQILYWLVVWSAVFVICRNAYDHRVVLIGTALAGIYASLSVICCCIVGGEEHSAYSGVVSSTGGFVTGKDLAGPLAASTFVALWIWRKSRTTGILAFFICTSGLIMTYQRAGQVAIVVAVLWLVAWYSVTGRKSLDNSWAIKPAIALTLAAVLVIMMMGISGFENRWVDLAKPEKEGSGRLAFWSVATNTYANLDLVSQLAGIGYGGVLNMMESRYGLRIHTHSDWFDILVMFGIVGVVGWVLINAAVLRIVLSCGFHTGECATGMAIFLIMLTESFFTGQVLGAHQMAFYLVSITCICASQKQPADC